MELISGNRLAELTGFSGPTIMKYASEKKIRWHEDSAGRRRFRLDEAQADIEALGIKPRAKRTAAPGDAVEAQDSTPQAYESAAEETATAPAQPEEAQVVLRRAIRKSMHAFKSQIKRAVAEGPSDEVELVLLRAYATADDIFGTIREAFLG